MCPSPAAANSWRRPSVNTLRACFDALYILLPGFTEYEWPVMLKVIKYPLIKSKNRWLNIKTKMSNVLKTTSEKFVIM